MSLFVPFRIVPLILASAALGACAAPVTEDAAGEASAVTTASPEYDAIIAGGTTVESRATPGSPEYSAITTLEGYIPGASCERTADTIAAVQRWIEISRDNGKRLVAKVSRPRDDHAPLEAGRTAGATVQFQSDDTKVELALSISLRMTEASELTVDVTNTNTFKAGPLNAFTVIKPGGYKMSLVFVPYRDGLVVKGRTTAKLERAEDKALSFTTDSRWVFEWLKGASSS